jgi:ABC-type Zn2+ transport system substrate-binding protein/surface adhesin
LNYLISDYNLNQVGIISPSELALPSLKHINSLKKTINKYQKICLLYEPGFPVNWVKKLKIHQGVVTKMIDPMGLNRKWTVRLYQNLMIKLSQNIISCLDVVPLKSKN